MQIKGKQRKYGNDHVSIMWKNRFHNYTMSKCLFKITNSLDFSCMSLSFFNIIYFSYRTAEKLKLETKTM